MLTRRSDSILLIVAVTLIVWSILLLYSRSSSSEAGIGIGKIIESNLQVRSRQSKSLTWKDLSGGSEVMDDQYVFTGDQARAKIQISHGPLIDISEKTLIKLHDPEKKSLTLERGIIRAFVSNEKPLNIEVAGKVISISGNNAEVVMNIQENEGEIGITSGEASLKVDNQIQKLNSSELINISKDPKKEMSITQKIDLLSPLSPFIVYQSASSRLIDFRWKSSTPGVLEISDDQEFKKIVYSASAKDQHSKQLPHGHYYWRVKTENARSQIAELTIIKERAPRITSPTNGEIIRVVDYEGDDFIYLNWEENEGPFDLEIKMQNKTSTFDLVYPPFEMNVSESKIFEWRVKKKLTDRPETVWSQWQKNQIQYIPSPQEIVNLTPVDYEQITYGEEPRLVDLKWKETQSPYEIEVKSGQYLETIQTEKSNYNYIIKNQGEYQWRVRTLDTFGRKSEFSDWQNFSWRDESEKLNQSAQKIVLKRPSQKVNFSWQSSKEQDVLFELSKDQSFKEVVITKKLKSDSTDVTFPDSGTYYWRTQEVKESGEKVFSKPKKVIIEPAPAPEKPESLPEVEIPLEYIESTQTKSFFDYFIASAFADEMKLGAPLAWPEKEEAEFYLIEIFSDPEGKNKIHELKTKHNQYRWEGAKIGEYYWRWAVVDYWGRISPFSDFSSLKLVPPQNFKLEKAKLVSPIRKKELSLGEVLSFQWTEIKETENYTFEVSSDSDFDEVIKREIIHKNNYVLDEKLAEGNYFWRVTTKKWNQSRVSSTGRFDIINPRPSVIEEKPQDKKYYELKDSLLILSWAPSLDSLNFETKNSKGDVSGNVLVGIKADYQKQLNQTWRFEASLLHQSGKVFDEENYKFRHTKLGASRKIFDRLTVAPSMGLVEFQEYSNAAGKLKASDQRSFDLGAELRYEFSYTESKWDIVGGVRLGGVISFGAGVRRWSEKWTQAIFFENRKYDGSNFEGSQSSIRLEIGRLFSFD